MLVEFEDSRSFMSTIRTIEMIVDGKTDPFQLSLHKVEQESLEDELQHSLYTCHKFCRGLVVVISEFQSLHIQ